MVAASSAVGSSPVKDFDASEKMDVDEDDAETARNRAAEALNDLASAAVISISSSGASGTTFGSSSVISLHGNDPSRTNARHVAASADSAGQQKRRPAALLTPTRRVVPSKNQHLSPNPSAAGPSTSRRSPLATSLDPSATSVSAGVKPEGSMPDQAITPLTANANVMPSPLYPASPNRFDRLGTDKTKGGYNSPFTNQPFVSAKALWTAPFLRKDILIPPRPVSMLLPACSPRSRALTILHQAYRPSIREQERMCRHFMF